jgi:hypothetical protein
VVFQLLDVLLLAGVLLTGCIQVRRCGLLARAQLGVLFPAQLILTGRLGRRGQPLLDHVRHGRITTCGAAGR